MHESNGTSLIKFTFIGVSTSFVIAKAAFNGNYSVIFPSKINTAGVTGIRAKAQITALVRFSHYKHLPSFCTRVRQHPVVKL